MADFEKLLVCDFNRVHQSKNTLETADQDRRIPTDYLSAVDNAGTDEHPHITIISGSGYQSQGLHNYSSASNNNTLTACLYSTSKAPSVELASFIRLRLFGGGANFGVAPACRISANGQNSYTAELIWVAGAPGAFKLDICKYTGDVRAVVASLANAITEYPVSSSNFGNRFYALGLQATGTGATVTLRAFLRFMYYTPDPSYNPTNPGSAPEFELNSMGASNTAVLTTTDSSSPFTSGAHGIKWLSRALTATDELGRLVEQFGLFKDIAVSRPTTPTISATSSDNATSITAIITTDLSADHLSTRWLLYEAFVGMVGTPLAVKDSGFLSGNKLTYTWNDLEPAKHYYIRFQVMRSNGDPSALSSAVFVAAGNGPRGIWAQLAFYNEPARSQIPKNSIFSYYDQSEAAGESVFKLAHTGTGATKKGPTIKRYGTIGVGQRRRFAWRTSWFATGGQSPYYSTLMCASLLLRWPNSSGLHIGVRSTAVDGDGYFVKKQLNGANWEYVLYSRQLNAGGSSGVGPWTETTLTTASIAQTLVSATTERVDLLHWNDGTTRYLSLFINGMLLANVSNADYGFGDPGHEWNVISVEPGADFDIIEYGERVFSSISYPLLPVSVDAFSFETGSAIHHPGPYMDPFDKNDSNNRWWQNTSKFRFRSGTATDGALIYWAPFLSSYDYLVKANIWGYNGLIARFRDWNDYIRARIVDIGGGNIQINLEIYEGGSLVLTVESNDILAPTDGSELQLQVAADPTSGSTAILIRVLYAGTLVIPVSGTYYSYAASQSTRLSIGRPGILRGSGLTATADEPVADSFEVTTGVGTSIPTTPTLSKQSGSETTIKVSVTLTSSVFSDADVGNTHAASQWQVDSAVGTFTSPLFDSGTDATNLTSITVGPGLGTWNPVANPGLNANTVYKARVRHRDSTGLWSVWATAITFLTGDPDTSTASIITGATFPADPIPKQVFSESVNFNTLISVMQSGKEQRRAKWSTPRLLFTLAYGPITTTQMDTLWNFYKNTAFGALNLFTFIHPIRGTVHICRFIEDNMTREMIEWEIEQTGLKLVEVPT